MLWHQIAYPKTSAEWIASSALLPVSWLYGVGWRSYEAVYRLGFKRRRHIEGLPVLGVGNLSVGGAGKTPVVIELLRLAKAAGFSPAVSASAYGSPASVGTTVLTPADSVDPIQHGDEPAMLRREFPNLTVILGRDRVSAALEASRRGLSSLLLDDGFQHLPLARTADLVIWDADLSNRRLLPAGPMREPLSGLRRASAVATPNRAPNSWEGPVFKFSREYVALRDVSTGEQVPLEWLNGRRADAICAIALPERFFEGLRTLGAVVRNERAFADHDALSGVSASDLPTIVTEKDATKIKAAPGEFFALSIRVRFHDEEAIAAWLTKTLSR